MQQVRVSRYRIHLLPAIRFVYPGQQLSQQAQNQPKASQSRTIPDHSCQCTLAISLFVKSSHWELSVYTPEFLFLTL